MPHPKELLQQYSLEPKKSLGQNFLFDENVLRRIVDAAELAPVDQVLEIGPGLGSLTKLLAETVAAVVAVELDERYLPILRDELTAFGNITLIHGDILQQSPASWFSSSYKVVANVPYYITGAILRHLLGGQYKPTTMVLTVQKEVAERVTAVPPHMSLLAVSTQFYGTVTKVTDIKAGSFWPTPDVDSAVIRIQNMPVTADALSRDEDFEKFFFRVAKAGFSQKRKQLQKNLRQLGVDQKMVGQVLDEVHVDGRRRAETLTLDEWHSLTQAFIRHLR